MHQLIFKYINNSMYISNAAYSPFKIFIHIHIYIYIYIYVVFFRIQNTCWNDGIDSLTMLADQSSSSYHGQSSIYTIVALPATHFNAHDNPKNVYCKHHSRSGLYWYCLACTSWYLVMIEQLVLKLVTTCLYWLLFANESSSRANTCWMFRR